MAAVADYPADVKEKMSGDLYDLLLETEVPVEAAAPAGAKPEAKRRARNKRRRVLVSDLAQNMQWDPKDEGLKVLPEISLCIDQGSVGWASHFFCLYVLGMNMVCMADLSHRAWNDAKGAIVSFGCLYTALVLSLNVMNLHMGPFESYVWWCQLMEAVAQCPQGPCHV